MGKADLHIHTNLGDGLDSIEAILEHVEARTDLDVLAITEHDKLEVALRAREAWARGRYRYDFVPGVEITTLEGHLVALFLEEPVPSLRGAEETIEAVHAQGGVCFVPHPMSRLTRSIGARTLDRLDALGMLPDGMELATASPTGLTYLAKAARLNRERYHLPVVGASDAHFLPAIGSGYTIFDGTSAGDLRAAFADGSVSGGRGRFPGLREIGLRGLAVSVAGWRATPKQLGWRRTAWSFVSRARG
jgi:predicted metal-dependent phosphoesterase TrpH